MYIGHKSEDGREQPLLEHLKQTAALCGEFAAAFGCGELGELLGLAHDIGKYSREFQDRILNDAGATDHSTAGGQTISELIGNHLFSYVIFGHHGGLPDGGTQYDNPGDKTLYGRLKRTEKAENAGKAKKTEIPNYSAYKAELNLKRPTISPMLRILDNPGLSFSLLVRMLFSCLADADFLDTEAFMSDHKIKRGGYDDEDVLLDRLERYIKNRFNNSEGINEKRNEILDSCRAKASYPQGLYSLTAPTGSGKTIASLLFALTHAKEHGLKRVIFVIPYTTIIEQNAAVFANILGKQNVVEHHHNANYDNEDPTQYRKYLSTENWDAPIIVTTNVQFFESLYASRPSHCRKLHNIAESVIVFDEAQMLPLSYLKPCVGAISELICNYRCTAVLCSATQPALDKFLPSQLARTEICDAPEDLQAFFRRASIEEIGTLDDEALATRLKSYEQVLCIVNTRKQAQNIYRMMEDRDCFHLSTLMTPLQRRWILRKARRRLTDGKPCRLVATSLVEAGVDVDFPVVYRGIAGLDSVIQAMGRCNREGRRGRNESKVYVFMPDPSYSVPSSQTRPIEVFRCVAQKYDDIASLPAIREYFEILYHFEGDGKRDTGLDKKGILKRFDDGANDYNFPFAAVAKDFRLIEDDTRVVLIPLGGGRRVARALRDGVRNRALMRKLGRYSVNIRENHCNTLFGLGIIEQLDEEIYVLCDKCAFDFNTGLALAPQGGQAVFWEG